jgi:hypothetical protein
MTLEPKHIVAIVALLVAGVAAWRKHDPIMILVICGIASMIALGKSC